MLEDEDFAYAYDAKGNRVSKTAKVGGEVESYIYDSQSRLVSYTSPTTNATYAYDALNRRVAKSVDGNVTASVYDLWGTDTSTASDILMDFEGGVLARRWAHSGRVDEPLSHEQYSGGDTSGSGSVYEMYADRMGSISKVVDVATGAVVAEYEYSSFGVRSTFSGTLFQHYGYTGREEDPESGLLYYRARHYDPVVGVFVQSDPLGFSADSINLYEYVSNNAFQYRDPSGHTKVGALRASGTSSAEFMLLSSLTGTMAVKTAGQVELGVMSGVQNILDGLNIAYNKMQGAAATNAPPPGDPDGQCNGGGGPPEDPFSKLKDKIGEWKRMLALILSLRGDDLSQPGYQQDASDPYEKVREFNQKRDEWQDSIDDTEPGNDSPNREDDC